LTLSWRTRKGKKLLARGGRKGSALAGTRELGKRRLLEPPITNRHAGLLVVGEKKKRREREEKNFPECQLLK